MDFPAFCAAQREKWNLFRWLAPIPESAREEKRRFLEAAGEGRRYEPRFAYPVHDAGELARDRDLLQSAVLPGGALGELLAEERDYLLAQHELVELRGRSMDFTRASIVAFEAPSAADVEAARLALARTPPDTDPLRLTGEQLGEMAREHLVSLGIAGWQVIVDPHLVSIMKIDSTRRRIELRGDFVFGNVDIISLLHHEIDGHVVRAENGWRLGHDFLGFGVGFETELDEGIACHFEDLHGGLVGRRFQELAARVVAVDSARRNGFWEVYHEVRDVAPLIGEDLSYQLTLRVKRGLEDTAEPGCWTKDALYFTGLRRVKEYEVVNGAGSCARDLMVARVSWKGIQPARQLAGRTG